MKKGDAICLVISPQNGNHSCDLTHVELTLGSENQQWRMSDDLSPSLLEGNPHADSFGNPSVWHFFSEPADRPPGSVIPSGSLLARWRSESDFEKRRQLAAELQSLLLAEAAPVPADGPDAQLYQQLTSLTGPLMANILDAAVSGDTRRDGERSDGGQRDDLRFGLPVEQFGLHPKIAGTSETPAVDGASLCVRAPEVIDLVLPAELLDGAEFVCEAYLHPVSGREGSVQVDVSTTAPKASSEMQAAGGTIVREKGAWTSAGSHTEWSAPVIVHDGSEARRRIERSFDEFRHLFPAALCYTRIVPVDEVVTLTLYFREDDHLRRLMLTEAETRELNRHWDELHYISRDALASVDALEQLIQFATQDGDPSVFEPLLKPTADAAEAFRKTVRESESQHLAALLSFAERAWRRPLSEASSEELRGLYAQLRSDGLSHDDALTVTLQRVLVAPSFLYRIERPGDGSEPVPVNQWELASRLSYFLWSSAPDDELRQLASAGRLSDEAELKSQLRRMLRDERIRRLATECFCQWLQIYDFDQLDEKSDRHFPSFQALKSDMYKEVQLYISDLLQRDGSVLDLFESDHAFVNSALAQHYGLAGVEGDHWRRVDGVRQFSRGGVLGFAATLAKQSGASRTSPILRGNWLSEVLLGEKLPKPPKGVPPLPDDESSLKLTMREVTERHTRDERCSGCHRRIDPYGFALETFDAIGRLRTTEVGQKIDSSTQLPDGTTLNGVESLKEYLLQQRRQAIVRQLCRKVLGYALGRAVQLSDQPLLDTMSVNLEGNEYRISSLLTDVVTIAQFENIRGSQNPSSGSGIGGE